MARSSPWKQAPRAWERAAGCCSSRRCPRKCDAVISLSAWDPAARGQAGSSDSRKLACLLSSTMCNANAARFPPVRPRRMAGVSLVELLAVVSIVAILMGIGLSSYKNLTIAYRITGEVNGLLGDMQYARSEAIKQGQNVVV